MLAEAISTAIAEKAKPRYLNNTLAGGTLISLLTFISGSRVQMGSNQITQALTLLEGDPFLLRTGFCQALRQTTWAIRVPCDCIVRKIARVFPGSRWGRDARNAETHIYYQEITSNRSVGAHGVIVVPAVHAKHVKFGFTYKRTKAFENMRENQTIFQKGTVLADSPAVNQETGDYTIGRRINVAYVPEQGTHEDGVIMNDSIRELYATEMITTMNIYLDQSQTLLNRYGRGDLYQPLPKIGDVVEDGLLAVVRKMTADNYFATMSQAGLLRVDETNDTVINCPIGARVVDVRVVKNTFSVRKRKNASTTPEPVQRYLDAYFDAQVDSYNIADDYYEEQKRKARREGTKFVVDPTLTNLASKKHSLQLATYQRIGKTKRPTMGRKPIGEYHIQVKLATKVLPNIGFKFSGLYGDKFTVTEIRPNDKMPIDKYGRRVGFLIDPRTKVARNNPGLGHEHFLHDALWHTRRYLLDLWEKSGDVEKVFDSLLDFAGRISTPWRNMLDDVKTKADKQTYLMEELLPTEDKFKNTINVYAPVDTPELGDAALRNLKGTPFYPERDHVTLYNIKGEAVTSKAKVRVAERMLYMLEKDGSDTSAVSAPKRQVTGITAKQRPDEKRYEQISKSPVRQYGEAEMRNKFFINREMAAVELATINNPVWFRTQMHRIYNPDSDVEYQPEEQRRSRGVEVLNHLNLCFGAKLMRTKQALVKGEE